MKWKEFDAKNIPTEQGYYVYLDTEGDIYTANILDHDLLDVALEQSGTCPTHYVYLEPVPQTDDGSYWPG